MWVFHDYVTQRGGAERVALDLARRFGGGRLMTSVYDGQATFPAFSTVTVEERFAWLPRSLKRWRFALAPLVALGFLTTRTGAGVIALCSSSGWSHWIRSSGPKVVYCYTPPRWLYASEDFFGGRRGRARVVLAPLLALMRWIDRHRARSAQQYLAISSVSQRRIQAAYGIDAPVIPPPVTLQVDGDQQPVADVGRGFFLTIARPRSYKNTQAVESAFSEDTGRHLVVVGDQTGFMSEGPNNVTRLGRVTEAELRWLYANCVATIGLSREDFGLTPVEGHMFGKPAVVLRQGGYLDTCDEGRNAVFVDEPTAKALKEALNRFERVPFDPAVIMRSAERFSPAMFELSLSDVLEKVLHA